MCFWSEIFRGAAFPKNSQKIPKKFPKNFQKLKNFINETNNTKTEISSKSEQPASFFFIFYFGRRTETTPPGVTVR